MGSRIFKKAEDSRRQRILWSLFSNITGGSLYAAGIYTFASNAGFAPGGISGLALILNYLWALPIGTVTLLLNIPLVAVSYRAVGRRLLINSAVSMAVSSLLLDTIFPLLPVYQGNRLLAAVCSGVFLGAGMAVFYLRGSSSGGIDFLALTIKKKKPHMTLGVINMLIDAVIILLGWPVFGDVDAVLYGILSTYISTVVIDKIMYGLGAGTLAVIVTSKGKETAAAVRAAVRRGVTALKGTGTYSGSEKDVLLCACSKAEAHGLKKAVFDADPEAFLMFTETNEVLGEGFGTENDGGKYGS